MWSSRTPKLILSGSELKTLSFKPQSIMLQIVMCPSNTVTHNLHHALMFHDISQARLGDGDHVPCPPSSISLPHWTMINILTGRVN